MDLNLLDILGIRLAKQETSINLDLPYRVLKNTGCGLIGLRFSPILLKLSGDAFVAGLGYFLEANFVYSSSTTDEEGIKGLQKQGSTVNSNAVVDDDEEEDEISPQGEKQKPGLSLEPTGFTFCLGISARGTYRLMSFENGAKLVASASLGSAVGFSNRSEGKDIKISDKLIYPSSLRSIFHHVALQLGYSLPSGLTFLGGLQYINLGYFKSDKTVLAEGESCGLAIVASMQFIEL